MLKPRRFPPVTDAPAPVSAAPAAGGPPPDSSALPDAPNAASPAPLSAVLQGKAKSDYDAGRLLAGSGDFAGALLKFQSAYQEGGDPRLLWNAAACERNLRHYANAIVLVRRFLDSHSPLITPDAAMRAEAFIEAAEPLTAPLRGRIEPTEFANVPRRPKIGAVELVSGVRIDLGTHRIAVEAPGFEPFAETLTVTSSAQVNVKAVLRPVVIAMPLAQSTHKDVAAPASHPVPKWLWVAGGCVC